MNKFFVATVRKVKKGSNYTKLQLDNKLELELPPYIYIQVGNHIEVTMNNSEIISVKKILSHPESGSKRVQLYPPYSSSESINISPHKFQFSFRERLSPGDWAKARVLEKFHYRGQGLNKIVGRRSVLIAEEKSRGILSYGVVSSTLPAVSPRFNLFETNFKEQMKTKLINQIVRIPRIVVHPEFRGIGLGTRMAYHLIKYVKSHWDVTGYAPILIEVIAAMTDYHGFFESAGFTHLGYTKGYNGQAITPQYGNGAFAERSNKNNYNFIKNQDPKPYLVFPLNAKMKRRLKEHMKTSVKKVKPTFHKPKLKRSITFEKVFVSYKFSNNIVNKRSLEVKEAFGVDSSQLSSNIIKDLTMEIAPGEMVMITGASGSGKSTILNLIAKNKISLNKVMNISGQISGLTGLKRTSAIAKLNRDFDDNLPLVEQLGSSTREAINLLNTAGLAEAHLYLKRPSQLSDGQKYRFAIAKLCDSGKSIWVADEFATNLDAETSAIVAKGLRKAAWNHGATVILASPFIANFIDSLIPNTIVKLSWGKLDSLWSFKMIYTQFKDSLIFDFINNSTHPITNVKVFGIDSLGKSHKLKAISLISPNSQAKKMVLPIVKLASFKSIVATTDMFVGDVVYLRGSLLRK